MGGLAPPLSRIETQEFLTGARPAPELERVPATVSFCDIVESTKRAEALGDRQWRALLDQHDEIAARSIERYRGQKIKSTGDPVRTARGCGST